MTKINKEQYNLLITRNCAKGKHRLRTNKFGVTWCVICGLLSSQATQDLLPEEKILLETNDD